MNNENISKAANVSRGHAPFSIKIIIYPIALGS
jgi:hypothetical protein